MKSLFLLMLAGIAPLAAQVSPADEDNVVVVVEGRSWKKSGLEQLVRSMGGNIPRNFYNDKRAFLQSFGLMVKLASLVEAEGLDKQEPYTSRLYYNRLMVLAQSRVETQNSRILIMPEDQKKYFEEHKLDYAKARVKVLYLAFNDNPMKSEDPNAKKPRTSAESEKLAAELVKQARAGKSFVELVKQHSDDPDSKGKDGDFPPINPKDAAMPEQVRSTVFALKPGQVSDPMRQAGGFWIFRLEEFVNPAYEEVRDDIFRAIQEAKFKEWMEGVQKGVKVEFKDQKYLDQKTPANLPPR